jgi:hypothetical protein
METQISKDLDITNHRSDYDESCKALLSHKSILAHILKSCVKEFKNCDVKYIAENCIGTPEISKTPVHRNDKQIEKILSEGTEDKTITEGTVYYDIRFKANFPDTDGNIELIVNIEAQNNYYPGYSLVKRGLYYCCRLISAQHETEFTGSNYNNIKKVYSIWICTDTPKAIRNTMAEYNVSENNLIGVVDEQKENYDIFNVVMLHLDKDSRVIKEGNNGILKLLRVLLSNKIESQNKKSVLSTEFNIPMDVKLEKELDNMCNLSGSLLKEGKILTKLEDLKNLISALSFTFEKAATILKIPEDEWEEYRNML